MRACDEMIVGSLEFLTLELQYMTHRLVEMHENNVACKLAKMVEVKAEDVFSFEKQCTEYIKWVLLRKTGKIHRRRLGNKTGNLDGQLCHGMPLCSDHSFLQSGSMVPLCS